MLQMLGSDGWMQVEIRSHLFYDIFDRTAVVKDIQRTEHTIADKYAHKQLYIAICEHKTGGDDGNRTRVRKPIHTTFSERSLLFRIPDQEREQAHSPSQ